MKGVRVGNPPWRIQSRHDGWVSVLECIYVHICICSCVDITIRIHYVPLVMWFFLTNQKTTTLRRHE